MACRFCFWLSLPRATRTRRWVPAFARMTWSFGSALASGDGAPVLIPDPEGAAQDVRRFPMGQDAPSENPLCLPGRGTGLSGKAVSSWLLLLWASKEEVTRRFSGGSFGCCCQRQQQGREQMDPGVRRDDGEGVGARATGLGPGLRRNGGLSAGRYRPAPLHPHPHTANRPAGCAPRRIPHRHRAHPRRACRSCAGTCPAP